MLISLILKVLFMRRHNRRHLWKEKIFTSRVRNGWQAIFGFIALRGGRLSRFLFYTGPRKHNTAATFFSSRFDFLSSIFVILEFKLFSIEMFSLFISSDVKSTLIRSNFTINNKQPSTSRVKSSVVKSLNIKQRLSHKSSID